MKNILFVIPKFVRYKTEVYFLPMGMLYIATILKNNNYNISVLNMNEYCEYSEDEMVAKYIKEQKVDLVCTGGLSAYFSAIENILLAVRKTDLKLQIILGGGIVTSDKEFIAETLNPDFCVFGEGEESALELINALRDDEEVKNILGIAYKKDEKWIFNENRALLENMNTVPWADYSLINMEDYFSRQSPTSTNESYICDFPRILSIVTSRSCPLKCTFCFHPTGQKYRSRDLDDVFSEVEHLIKTYNINILVVLDEMMSASKKRMIEFSRRIKKYNIHWTCQTLVNSIDEETLIAMKDSGCYYVNYGLESMSNKILKSMKKHGITKEKIEKTLEMTVRNKVSIQGNFIFGDSEETLETVEETLTWWRNNSRYQIYLGLISPYPGTELYYRALNDKVIEDKERFMREGTPPLNLTKMTKSEYANLVSRITYESSKARHFCELESVAVDNRTEDLSYLCKFKCPHCNEVVEYGNIKVHTYLVFKLACRNCGLRFDVKPRYFPHLEKLLIAERERILDFKSKYNSFVLSPAASLTAFLEYFEMIDVNYKDFNFKYVLDSSNIKINEKYLDKIEIIPRDKDKIDEWKESGILVISANFGNEIIEEFKGLGITEDKTFYANTGQITC